MSDTTVIVLALCAVSLSLIAISRTHHKDEKQISIDWKKVMKVLTIPMMIVIGVIGYFFIIPNINSYTATSELGMSIDANLLLLPLVAVPIAAICGLCAMLYSFREPKKAASNADEKMKKEGLI